MSKQRRTLKQIATDMRAAGEMLIEGASEIEAVATMLESVNLNALTALLGGGPAEGIPFLQRQQPSPGGSTPAEQRPRRRATPKRQPPKLSKEQKDQIRDRWNRLPEAARTDAMRSQLADQYGVTSKIIGLIVSMDMEAARQRMAAARARIGHSRSDRTPATHTSVN